MLNKADPEKLIYKEEFNKFGNFWKGFLNINLHQFNSYNHAAKYFELSSYLGLGQMHGSHIKSPWK